MTHCTRRSFVRAGALAGLGLGDLLRGLSFASQDDAIPAPRAKGLIHIFLPGGMAHQETFDPKPYSPVSYRGQVRTIDTVLPGVRFGQHLQRTAKIADRITVIRSFTHGEADHNRGVHNMLTGYRPSPAVVYPSLGSVVSHELGSRKSLPPYVCVPNQPNAFAGTGYLSASYAPFALGDDPSRKNFKVRDLDLPKGVDAERFERRRAMLGTIDRGFGAAEGVDGVEAMDSFYERAYEMLSSQEAKDAFKIDAEDAKVRDRYGRSGAGQRLLLARRLVESGVRYVTVTIGGWDHHERIADGMRNQLPPVDQAYSALIEDLDSRGLLDETLVLLSTEFGRSPKVNKTGGRDHWPGVFSVVLAGGGVKRGYVHGASDSTASAVESKAVGPEDLARTVFTLIGIDPDKSLLAGGNRPLRLVKGGRVLHDVLERGGA
jgi:hypothetical protein